MLWKNWQPRYTYIAVIISSILLKQEIMEVEGPDTPSLVNPLTIS